MRRNWRDDDKRSDSTSREVNSLLHTLRGEQFRHLQNVLHSRAHLILGASHTHNDPSLPFSDIYKYAHSSPQDNPRVDTTALQPLPVIQNGHLQHGYPRGPVPGPPIPKSWRGLFGHDPMQDRHTVAFHREALSLVFSYAPWSIGSNGIPFSGPSTTVDRASADASATPAVPPLTQMCLGVLLSVFPDASGFKDELLPMLPSHFRRDVLRYTAVHAPLSNGKLHALCQPEGHADGELIVVGPQATLLRDLLACSSPGSTVRRQGEAETDDLEEGPSHRGAQPSHQQRTSTSAGDEDEDLWEVESSSSQNAPPPLHTLIVLNASVSSGTLFAFPLTATRLALLALPTSTPVHRLPRICPLLEVLDLSYNSWLNDPSGGSESMIERIEWGKWMRLRVLGLRACNVPESVVWSVNKGREEEVEVIGVTEQTFGSNMSVVEGMMKSLRLSD